MSFQGQVVSGEDSEGENEYQETYQHTSYMHHHVQSNRGTIVSGEDAEDDDEETSVLATMYSNPQAYVTETTYHGSVPESSASLAEETSSASSSDLVDAASTAATTTAATDATSVGVSASLFNSSSASAADSSSASSQTRSTQSSNPAASSSSSAAAASLSQPPPPPPPQFAIFKRCARHEHALRNAAHKACVDQLLGLGEMLAQSESALERTQAVMQDAGAQARTCNASLAALNAMMQKQSNLMMNNSWIGMMKLPSEQHSSPV